MTTTTNNAATNTNAAPHAIYVASLSDYTSGVLHGAWIQINTCNGADELRAQISAMLAASPTAEATGQPAEEWAVFDHEGWPCEVGEYSSPDTIMDAYDTLMRLDSDELDALDGYMSENGYDLSDLAQPDFADNFFESFHGWHESEEDFTRELIADIGLLNEIPEHLRYYFDVAAYTRDLFLTDYYMTDGGYVFRHL